MKTEIKIEKFISKSGVPSLKVNEYFLHSNYNPIKEAEQLAKKNYKINNLHVLFGHGLGYLTSSLLNMFSKNDSLIIIDPLYESIEPIDNWENVKIISDFSKDHFESILTSKLEHYKRNVQLVCSPNYDKLFPELYKEVLVVLKTKLSLNNVSENTIRFFAKVWQENYINNLYYAFQDQSIENLRKSYTCPFVIASGGPSLTKQLKLLKSVENQVIIIAAGSTINTLLKNDIEPHYVVSVDGGISNFDHFKNLHLNKTKLIYSMTNHHGIRDVFTNKQYTFLSSGNNLLVNHIHKISNERIPYLPGGGSVANFAFTISKYMTSGPIALIGQDLAYTNNKSHAEHNKFYKEVDDNFKKTRGTFYEEGYNGDEVLTDYVFLSMKKSFEQLHSLFPHENQVFNCTEGGIKLNGFEQLTFQKFCDKYIGQFSTLEYEGNSSDKETSQDSWENFKIIMKKEEDYYYKLEKILNESLTLLSNNKSKTSFSQKVVKSLNKNDQKVREMLEKVSMSSIVDPITIDINQNYLPKENEELEDIYLRVYNQNRDLYTKLIEAISLSRKFTRSLIQRIDDNINIKEIN